MDLKAFSKLLSKRFYPLLRSEGFRGSGATLRRYDDPVVHVFNVQGSSGGTSCYLNMGAHLMFLPTPAGSTPDAKKLKEYECVFRGRLEPPTGPATGWAYGTTEAEMQESVSSICDHWPKFGYPFYERYSHYPDDFSTLIAEVDECSVHPIELLTLARLAVHLGDAKRANELAEEGLTRCPERACDLRAKLQEIRAR